MKSARKHLRPDSSHLKQQYESIRKTFIEFHEFKRRIGDSKLDDLLSLKMKIHETSVNYVDMLLELGNEKIEHQATPYQLIRKLYTWVAPSRSDTVYDIGAGYGRVLFYGALTCKGRYRGIELVPQRVVESMRIRNHLRLRNLDFIQGNAACTDLQMATIFFFFNPLFSDTLKQVGRQIRSLAKTKQIRIASLAQSNDYFSCQRWLRECTPPATGKFSNTRYGLRLFRSIAADSPY